MQRADAGRVQVTDRRHGATEPERVRQNQIDHDKHERAFDDARRLEIHAYLSLGQDAQLLSTPEQQERHSDKEQTDFDTHYDISSLTFSATWRARSTRVFCPLRIVAALSSPTTASSATLRHDRADTL